MRLCEFEAKALMQGHGIPIPRGNLVNGALAEAAWPAGGVAKAQLLSGGRGKSGLVRMADTADALAREVEALRSRLESEGKPAAILVEEKLDIAAEYYLSFVIDDVLQRSLLLFSRNGGVDIEAAGDAVRSFPVDPLIELRPHHLLRFFQDAGVSGDIRQDLRR